MWRWFQSGGSFCGVSLCKDGSFMGYSSAIVKYTKHGEGGDKGGDEGGDGGDGGGVSCGDGGGKEKNHYNQL